VIHFSPVDGNKESKKVFAGIIEREGRFKILSYSNAF
jgi:hypothetical protein